MTALRTWTLAMLGITLAGCVSSARRATTTATAPAAAKPRVVVTTDPELADSNSLLR